MRGLARFPRADVWLLTVPDPTQNPDPNRPPSVWEDSPAPGQYRGRQPQPPSLWKRLTALSLEQLLVGVGVMVLLLLIGASMFRPEKKDAPPASGTSDRALAISPDGSKLAMGLRDGSIRVFRLKDGRATPLVAARLGAPVLSMVFGPKEDVIALMAPGVPDPRRPQEKEADVTLQIFSPDLKTRVQRRLQANAHDLVWSAADSSLIVLSGGADDLHARLEVFPNQPFDITTATSQLIDLHAYNAPRHLAITNDGSRIAVSFDSNHRVNLVIFDWKNGKAVANHLVRDSPEGVAFSPDGERVAVASPEAEEVTFILPKQVIPVQVPKSSSMSPPQVLVFNPEGTRAYIAGGLTLPEIAYDPAQVARKAELPHRSSSIVISPDGNTAYLSYDDSDDLGIFNLTSGAGLAVTWHEEQ
jgi:WD40 repeat protein